MEIWDGLRRNVWLWTSCLIATFLWICTAVEEWGFTRYKINLCKLSLSFHIMLIDVQPCVWKTSSHVECASTTISNICHSNGPAKSTCTLDHGFALCSQMKVRCDSPTVSKARVWLGQRPSTALMLSVFNRGKSIELAVVRHSNTRMHGYLTFCGWYTCKL